jgi:tetratricopeptide (TPR) repeat protein
MKKFILILTISLFSSISYAQVSGIDYDDKNYGKLLDLIIMDNYEDCLARSLKLIDNDKYKKESAPLLFASICYFKISQDPELEEAYPKSFLEAMKYAAKAATKDKTGEFASKNYKFYDELKEEALKQADYLYNEDNFSKAASFYAKILKFSNNDPNILFTMGYCQLMAKNKGEGDKNVATALKTINENYADPNFEADEISSYLLTRTYIAYTNYLVSNNEIEKAIEVIETALKFLPDDDEIKSHRNKLVN